ncbi:MAG TPA: sigma-54 dependent transcriptional regulator [Candidatus Krumholzibacteria bacterium]|nr:sigma-54 dependent transcriptional regulator [Candidatus Krumholzibacteria bacterium]
MLIGIAVAVGAAALRERLMDVLEHLPGVAPVAAPVRTATDLWPRLHEGDLDVVIVERHQLPGDPAAWVAEVRALPEQPEVVVFAAREDPQERATLLAAGCLAVLNAGLGDADLASTLAAFVQRRRTEGMQILGVDAGLPRSSLQDFVSRSEAMQQFMATARRVVHSGSSLLILGETGVGKERLARSIHQDGPSSTGPFLAVNCGALPETLLESELFGHERGAFTGATRTRRGYFELAHGGTIFLDEIAEMPLHLQVKLLRVLEDRRVQRLGGESAVPVNVRIMAATNRDLDEEVRARRFRSDLYYRLAVVTLTLPPLRLRREDVPDLVESYLRHFVLSLGRPLEGVTSEAMEALVRYDWPGNVRELINVMERMVLLAPGPMIELVDLPRAVAGRREAPAPPAATAAAGLPRWRGRTLADAKDEVLSTFLRGYLSEVLTEADGRMGDAAARAGVNVRTLYQLMREQGLRKEDFRGGGR